MARLLDKDDSWQDYAACLDEEPNDFFPVSGGPTKGVLALCRRCPVRGACLTYALTPPIERFGTWGGTTWQERKRLLGHRARRLNVTTTTEVAS